MRIANTVWFQLVDVEGKRAERRGTSEDVTDYLVRGRAAWHRGYDKGTYRAVAEMYQKALQLEGHNPIALTGLADALVSALQDFVGDTPEDDLWRAPLISLPIRSLTTLRIDASVAARPSWQMAESNHT